MDARLRKRCGVLRVSASRHIDCSVRRRPSRAGAFLRHAGKLVSGSSRPVDALVLGLDALHPAAVPPAAALFVGSAALVHRARDAPSSAFRPRSPRPVLAHRAPFPPYPSTSGGKSLILKRVADNRAPYSRFRFQNVSKTATHQRVSAKQEIFRAAFAF